MTSEHSLDEREYVQQLIFVELLDELRNFFNILIFHVQAPFVRGRNECSRNILQNNIYSDNL